MRKTIYLPDDLAAEVETYLDIHRSETFSSLVQSALKQKVGPKDRRSILDLIGFVSVEPRETGKDVEGRPEDSTADWYDGPSR
jgi:metal-responsive CopG/Arc/MetJ family transcriptional regulator